MVVIELYYISGFTRGLRAFQGIYLLLCFNMGREIDDDDDDVEFERYHHHHPGCMAAIFDYHHWYNVKKMFHYRKYNRGRHVRCKQNIRLVSSFGKFSSEAAK